MAKQQEKKSKETPLEALNTLNEIKKITGL